jgi:DNA repair protein RadA/Sms
MAKQKTVYRCDSCGHEEPKWLGRCPECGSWNSMEQSTTAPATAGHPKRNLKSVPLEKIEVSQAGRFDSGMEEFNRILGGGIMNGSSILVGGEPGIGKSTVMLQMAAQVKTSGRVIYISGEESPGQIKMRADRLRLATQTMEVLSETNLETVMTVLDSSAPVIVVVDSVQTLVSQEIGSVPGTVNQLKYCCAEIITWAREHSAAVFLVAHVTKEGTIAGPKILEHMVDAVLYFDQTGSDLRILRGTKNRFGSVDEIGLFTMQERGLVQVTDPSSIFMVRRSGELPAGIAVAPVYEGSRVLLVEIQALVVPAKGAISRVFSERVDASRVSRVAAVLEKHLDLRFTDHDIYVNVAGGIRLGEVGIELPLALALYSARTGRPLPQSVALAGELSLAGEIRPIPHLRRRARAASDMGFTRFIGPQSTRTGEEPVEGITKVSTIGEGIREVYPPG